MQIFPCCHIYCQCMNDSTYSGRFTVHIMLHTALPTTCMVVAYSWHIYPHIIFHIGVAWPSWTNHRGASLVGHRSREAHRRRASLLVIYVYTNVDTWSLVQHAWLSCFKLGSHKYCLSKYHDTADQHFSIFYVEPWVHEYANASSRHTYGCIQHAWANIWMC